ncbi:MAG: HAD hydrolase family protein [Bacteroidota bacterium]
MRLNNLNEIEFYAKLEEIKIFMFDLDGVLLYNTVDNDNIFQRMTEFASRLKNGCCYAGIITARIGDELTTKLNTIENCFVITSSLNKKKKMEEKLSDIELNFEDMFYIGDDILDIPLLQKAELSGAPSNARREVKRAVDIVLDEEESTDLLGTMIQLIEHKHID